MQKAAVMLNCLAFSALGLCLVALRAQQAAASATTVENQPAFDIASIKPSRPDDSSHNWNSHGGRVSIENYTLRRLIRSAYDLKSDSQVLGGPDWIGKRAFDIEAKFGDAETAKLQKMSGYERRQETNLALQALLADRFRLQTGREARTIPVYALVVAKSGAKLTASAPQLDRDGKPKVEKNHGLHTVNGHMMALAIPMNSFADWFSYLPECDRVVVDRTGLSGEYDFKLNWTEDSGQDVATDAPLPGLFTALREQLGLELKSDKAPVDVVVVKSAKEPELD